MYFYQHKLKPTTKMKTREQAIEKILTEFKSKFLSLSKENKVKMINNLKERPTDQLPQDEKNAAKLALEFAENNLI